MQFITNTDGEKTAVVISVKEYEHFLRVQDEYEDIKSYDEAMSTNDWIPIEDVKKDLGL